MALDIQGAPKLDIQGAPPLDIQGAAPLDIQGTPTPAQPVKLDVQPAIKPQPAKIANAPEPGLNQKMVGKLPASSLTDHIKDIAGWLEDTGSRYIKELPDALTNMINEVSQTGKEAAGYLQQGNLPAAFGRVAQPVLQPFTGLENMATQGPPSIPQQGQPGKAALQGIEMGTGIPAGDIWDKMTHGNIAGGLGEATGSLALMGLMSKFAGGEGTPEITAPAEKPRFRVNPDGTFTNLADGTIMDKAGNPVTPVTKLADKLSESRVKNVEQADIYARERAPKFANAAAIAENQATPEGASQAADQMISALGGQHTKVSIDPLELPQEDMDNLYHTIQSNQRYQTTDKIHALTGMKKLEVGSVPQDNEIDAISKFFGLDVPDTDDPGRVWNLLNKLSSLSGKTTRMVLGFHIPGTAYGFHGINEGIRNTLYGPDFNPLNTIGRGLESAYYLARPTKANDYLETNAVELDRAIRDGGLRVTTPDTQADQLFSGNNFLTRGINYITDPKPLFQQVIPAFKLKAYTAYRDQMIQAGVPYKEAAQMSGYNTNNQFGGVNLSGFMANEDNRKLFRIAALAPDWMASNYRLGSGMAQSIPIPFLNPATPQGRMYRVGMANFLGSYVGLNLLNALNNNGKFMMQNDTGHEMDVAWGKDDKGRTRYISPYGTAMDMIRLPMGIVHAALTGQVGQAFNDVRSRISEPLQMATDLIANEDYKGTPLMDKTKYGKPISIGQSGLNIGTDLIDHFSPVGAQAIMDYSQNKISEEELMTKLLQAPVRYKLPPRGR